MSRHTRGTGRRINSIQVARGLAALAVVAFHALATQPKYFGADVLPDFFSGGMVGIDLFFVISGFVMVLTTRGRHGAVREVGVFAWNRAFRIYPTYWVYALMLIPVVMFLPGFVNSSQGGNVDIVGSLLLLPGETLPILLVAWTLTLELWFYIVFAVILALPERFLIPALGAWALVLVLLNWNGPQALHPLLQVPANSMAIEFIFGGVAAILFRHVNRYIAIAAGALGVAVLLTLGTASIIDIYSGPDLVRPLTVGLGFGLVVLGVTAFEQHGGIGVFSKLRVLGDMSYSVYLSHVLVLAVTGRVWLAIAGPLWMNPLVTALWWVATLVAVLGVGYASYRLIERPTQAFAKKWRLRVFSPVAPEPKSVVHT
ncbi:peptidoglycan/LPS O-acetylase OafA/YrhL [Glaciihabitans tibetensis]|uniref:Peptidoglycan/LPS O-acetylase OafA/YrhL n=1 Tax=Glaciihabitans tibetensis TaxID=1266600 RepID=A0A2T0VI88_9MICO|nr:acyltransferase [Glaciihabitans tibetensis]PRY69949.1 peptidoglycan/LPS O-acetylase OafA/YrhL [Glaciihabitans tibetensis]